jgi:threonyl-tRNA synthetase
MANSMLIDNREASIKKTSGVVLACVVKKLYPNAYLGVGSASTDGFYYDFESSTAFQSDDLKQIQDEMKKLIVARLPITVQDIVLEEAYSVFEKEPYKKELIADTAQNNVEQIAICRIGDFVDLLPGELLGNTGDINANELKLQRSSGAYWKDNAGNRMLQRIFGVVFEKEGELEEYETYMEEISKRDHRVLGKQMDLFSLNEEIGLGLPLFHPKGAMVRYLMQGFSQKAHILNDYKWLYTPHIGRSQLWETSGHLGFYRESMYSPIDVDGEGYYLKPMSCPFHIMVYNDSPKSYNQLPLRYTEYASVYRYEMSGTLQGLTRVRGFTQDDAHIICTPEQTYGEVKKALEFSLYILRSFGLENFKAYVATKPEKKFIGRDDQWNDAIEQLIKVVQECNLPYEIDEGGGAFYGPKIDLKINDVLGREWQCSTVQFDFNLPERFNMTYIGDDNERHTPQMVHRALFGSIERFFALLVEHYAGEFPLWLAPVQVSVIPINNKTHMDYAQKIFAKLKRREMRVEMEDSGSKLGVKLAHSQTEKIPYAFIIGQNEVNNGTISVRSKKDGDLGSMTLDEWFQLVKLQLDIGIPKYLDA